MIKQLFSKCCRKIHVLYTFFSLKHYWEIRAIGFSREFGGVQSKLGLQHDAIRKELQALNIGSDFKLLEIGCGFGRNLKFLAEECGLSSNQIQGSDFSENMIKIAKAYLYPNEPQLFQADIVNDPLPTKSYDLILSHGVLMHIPPVKLGKAIQNIISAMKLEGHLILIEEKADREKINTYTFSHKYQEHLEFFFDISRFEVINGNLYFIVAQLKNV